MLVNAVRYLDGRATDQGDLGGLLSQCLHHGGFVWAGVHDPDPAEIENLVSVFGLHPLAVEDVVNAGQRPKVERYDDWLLIVLHTGRYLDEPETVDFGEIQILCNDHSVIVIRRGDAVPLAGVRRKLESRPQALADGPVAAVHAVLDRVVDSYESVLAGLDDDVSEVELDVFADDQRARRADLLERIYFLQREVLETHRAMQPLTSALDSIRNDAIVLDNPGWDEYFRDVADHLQRQVDQLRTLRELISSALSANATQVGLQQNDDMRKISAWVAIAAVPTMIAGIYGMNFEHMPELDSTWAYPAVLALMVVACLTLHRAFRKSGWL
ncbi:MAG: magnesium and cobalt transport protein CorA [Ilumatobacteraceae bacterium]